MNPVDDSGVADTAGGTKTAILDAAEKHFSMSGYEGTPMRKIATEAGVTQALLHYHFDTKERLFEAMFARRANDLNGERLRALAECRAAGQVSPAAIVEAFFRPILAIGRDEARGGLYFSRIMGMTANSTDPRSCALIHTYFDAMAREFIAALASALPDLDQADAHWGYQFMVGAGIMSMTRTGRIDALSGGVCNSQDVEAILERVVPFVVTGLAGLAARARRSAEDPSKAVPATTDTG